MRKLPTARNPNRSTIKNDPFGTVIPMPTELTELETLPPAEPVVTALVVEPVVVEEEHAPAPSEAAKPVPKARAANADRKRREEPSEPSAKAGKQKLSVHLEAALADRLKNAAYWDPRLTISGIAEYGIRHAIEKFERERGSKYPPREGRLVGGQAIK
jgi:hypothetical protein